MKPTLTILRTPCSGCPFKGRLELGPGRLRDIMETCRQDDAPFTCHQTIDVGAESVSPVWTPGAAVCAGWLEAVRTQPYGPPSVIQVAERLGLVTYREEV